MKAKMGEAKAFLGEFLGSPIKKTDECILWPFSIDRYGYGRIRLGSKDTKVHIVVCEHFHGPRPLGMEVAHSCNVRHCYNPAHLRWATPQHNQQDRINHGTALKGEFHGQAKLTAAQVAEIRERHATGNISQGALARELGIHQTTIGRIVNHQRWKGN